MTHFTRAPSNQAHFFFPVDGIPNGGHTISKSGSLPRSSWKSQTYHGMYQS